MLIFEQIFLFKLNLMPDQKLTVLIDECLLSMMLFLPGDVSRYIRHARLADREGRETSLPVKLTRAVPILVDPFGRAGLDGPQHVRHRNPGQDAAQNVNAIVDVTNRIEMPAFPVDNAADVRPSGH